jgi:hypothetical protein
MNSLILERFQIVEGFPAVNLATAANNGDYVSLKHAARVAVVFTSGIGTAGEDPVLTIQQASDVSGTGAKALNIPTASAFKKQAATSLAAVAAWSSASGDVSTNTLTNATSAEESALWVVEFTADELDVDNGFDCIRATVADVGTGAQTGYLFYLLELKEQAAPTLAVNCIA